MRPTFHRITLRDVALFSLPVLVAVGLALWYVLNFVQPAPQKKIVITTGGETGAYFKFAKKYEAILERSKIKLEVRKSAGSIENLNRIKDGKSDVDAALIQGGLFAADEKERGELLSLGRLFYEPLWIFYAGEQTYDRLTMLKGKRLAVGPEGSGTYALVTGLLAINGITKDNSTFLPLTGMEAIAALEKREVDVIFLAQAAEAPSTLAALRNRSFKLMNFVHAEAYTRRLPYLTKLVLPQGAIDLAENLPSSDINLVATSATLVVRDELHPALVYLLAQAAQEVHGGATLFNAPGEFPKAVDPELKMSDDATRYYKNGAPFLQRYFPFWLANFVERMIVLGVPLLTIAIPLFKIIPWLYRWRIRERMLYWYSQIKKLEASLEEKPTPGQLAVIKQQIDKVEDEVNESPVPLGFSEQFYNLRGHIDLVRNRVNSRAASV